MTVPKLNRQLRAHFKEGARRIVARDRAARRYGQSQNTIGEIERALADAFLLGRDAREIGALNKPLTQGLVEWIEIPPRARDTLFSVTGGFCRKHGQQTSSLVALERIFVNRRHRWRVIGDDSVQAKTFSDGGVLPLVKLALLERSAESNTSLRLTELGIATCREFWRRWNDRDPTLPLMGMRG
ncbi:hypothetical protein NKH09_21845 [Mesorhizobium sp. M1339]|uniref:hypothetical protein n=1 Tax=Mesorhizobium sp. M1339 TaxID=2957086 RepID=UPI00333650F4